MTRLETWALDTAVTNRKRRGRTSVALSGGSSGGTTPVAPARFASLVLNEDFSGGVSSSRWVKEDSTYGSPARYGRYRPENVTVSPASSGGTGNSLKLTAKHETYIDRDYTGGQISSRDAGAFYPRWAYYEFLMKAPHMQGVWPAGWLRHRDGSPICEVDIMERFHAETPGKDRLTVHYTDTNGAFHQNAFKVSTFVETPTANPLFHKYAMSMQPVPGQPDQAQFYGYVDDVLVYSYLQPGASNWTSRYDQQAFDICLQGAQIGGPFVGHPEDPLGYSRNRNGGGVTGSESGGCIVSGTAPNSCTTTIGGMTTRAPSFPNDTEIDYVRVWGYTG